MHAASKLLQVQRKWYRERKPQKIQNLRQKKSKNYSTPYELLTTIVKWLSMGL
jgi:hypothetical protein